MEKWKAAGALVEGTRREPNKMERKFIRALRDNLAFVSRKADMLEAATGRPNHHMRHAEVALRWALWQLEGEAAAPASAVGRAA
jgi:hypothetical protein